MFLIDIRLKKMCDKAILENGGTLDSQYKTQEMCDKAIDNYAYLLEFVPECYKTHENA